MGERRKKKKRREKRQGQDWCVVVVKGGGDLGGRVRGEEEVVWVVDGGFFCRFLRSMGCTGLVGVVA